MSVLPASEIGMASKAIPCQKYLRYELFLNQFLLAFSIFILLKFLIVFKPGSSLTYCDPGVQDLFSFIAVGIHDVGYA